MSFKTLKIGFIGSGNMNSAIIGGLINNDFDANQIMTSDPNEAKLAELKNTLGIEITTDNKEVARFADILIIGVKPNYVAVVCEEVSTVASNTLIISVAAGITTTQINKCMGNKNAIVRVMPNTPCLYSAGMVGLYADSLVTAEQRNHAAEVFKGIAELEWFDDEASMDLVTAISGSGPAYFFYIADAMIKTAEQQGMSTEQAKHLVIQTMSGAAKMLKESPLTAGELRAAVTSPGGTTAAALEVFNNNEVAEHLAQAIKAAEQRGLELSRENDSN